MTLDGPAGAGKSTVVRETARRLGLRFLDTGAMYRAFTWKALAASTSLTDPAALVAMIRASHFEWAEGKVVLDGRDITSEIRDENVTRNSRHLADPPEVRAELVRLQQEIGREGGLVTEGRDQGTVVFPNAEFKFYLDASIEVRAVRRYLETGGELESLKRAIAERDHRDRTRPVGALRIAPGAVVIDTSHLTIDQTCEVIRKWVAGSVGDPDLERVAALWKYLQRVQFEAIPGASLAERLGVPPWQSKDPQIHDAWSALTHPVNLRALERSATSPDAQKALEECRARMRVDSSGPRP